MGIRIARLLLAGWLIVGPFLLGFGGSFAQRQDTVAGLILLPLMLLGLFLPGMRVALLLVGPWLLLSPSLSGMYSQDPIAFWHDRIAGLACVFLGLLPFGRIGTREAEPAETRAAGPATVPREADATRPGWSGLWRRRRLAR